MLTLRKSQDRGYADHGWLQSYHSFSFAGYHDPAHMGTGVMHSEFNHAEGETTHFLQIWILPNVIGIPPGYEQKTIPTEQKRGVLRLVASPDGAQDSVTLHADAAVYAGLFDGTETAEFALDPARKGYVHLIRGALVVSGQRLRSGDAVLLENESRIALANGSDAEVLVFDLAA